jgi:hypothetical protein
MLREFNFIKKLGNYPFPVISSPLIYFFILKERDRLDASIL